MTSSPAIHNVGIYLFDDVEVLDFAGPFEVFSTASRVHARLHPQAHAPFQVYTIGDTIRSIRARGGLLVQPSCDVTRHPTVDVLVIPGGVVSAEMLRPTTIEWIARTSATATLTASVCTGAMLLAKAGLLDGKLATTHWSDLDELRESFPGVTVQANQRWIDTGNIITSAGISAGLDMSLHLVSRLAGHELAVQTARQMEYTWPLSD